jgi:hypothetical protein
MFQNYFYSKILLLDCNRYVKTWLHSKFAVINAGSSLANLTDLWQLNKFLGLCPCNVKHSALPYFLLIAYLLCSIKGGAEVFCLWHEVADLLNVTTKWILSPY